ncbi:hypothetical protein ABZ920_19265 [Streptomyces sp. NPDC046831]|uniref:hypothetical protein n=1 Tax=Streptomyces sp. NPDC046831 TaxID=3154805 RepID=UPI00340732F6
MIYCGIDWAERTHDVALVDDTGQLLAKRHITDDAAGYTPPAPPPTSSPKRWKRPSRSTRTRRSC